MMAPGSGASLDAGARIGPYRILGELGGGGMGVVYRAVHTLLQRPAAIKVLRAELSSCADAAERFQAEACATAAIRHPGVVEVYDYGYTETGHAFIAMELLEGQTLAARLAQRGRPSSSDAMQLVRQIAAPLAAAHERGVVHRDLKPENVFLVTDRDGSVGQVKILDFGVAMLPSSAAAEQSVGLIVGTPAYMAPEQCRGAARCDHRTDLYALGCILFELLTGAPPYGRGGATDELVAAHLRSPVPELRPELQLPPGVARLVARLLAKSVDERPNSALEVIADIERWLAADGNASARRGVCRFTSWVAGGIASSIAELGSRVRFWRSVETMPRGAINTSAPTADSRWPGVSGDARAVFTDAPTQPVIEIAGRDAPAPEQLASN